MEIMKYKCRSFSLPTGHNCGGGGSGQNALKWVKQLPKNILITMIINGKSKQLKNWKQMKNWMALINSSCGEIETAVWVTSGPQGVKERMKIAIEMQKHKNGKTEKFN